MSFGVFSEWDDKRTHKRHGKRHGEQEMIVDELLSQPVSHQSDR